MVACQILVVPSIVLPCQLNQMLTTGILKGHSRQALIDPAYLVVSTKTEQLNKN